MARQPRPAEQHAQEFVQDWIIQARPHLGLGGLSSPTLLLRERARQGNLRRDGRGRHRRRQPGPIPCAAAKRLCSDLSQALRAASAIMAPVRRTALRSAVSRASGGRSEWRRRSRRRTVRGRRPAPAPASATTRSSATADDDRALDQLCHDVVDDALGRLAAPPARPGVSRAERPLDQLLQHRLHLAHLAALRLAR